MSLPPFEILSRVLAPYRTLIFLLLIALPISLYLYHTWARLRRIPGPLLARFTDLPRFSWVWSRRAHDIHIDLHAKHGKLVRFGPNMVSVGDPSEIPNIYKMHAPLQKVCIMSSKKWLALGNIAYAWRCSRRENGLFWIFVIICILH